MRSEPEVWLSLAFKIFVKVLNFKYSALNQHIIIICAVSISSGGRVELSKTQIEVKLRYI